MKLKLLLSYSGNFSLDTLYMTKLDFLIFPWEIIFLLGSYYIDLVLDMRYDPEYYSIMTIIGNLDLYILLHVVMALVEVYKLCFCASLCSTKLCYCNLSTTKLKRKSLHKSTRPTCSQRLRLLVYLALKQIWTKFYLYK